ncbi:bifunctional metallophosphatase/5'-nucleotidase [Jeotgalibacillus soli]|uniref:5'-nucleotidase n=1 Tax=Jeotgalibacillus soli TaxID=889306 RepID=A0A0C2QX42_9BACL|nr:bifunctional UDP-sugar hydrolase/5'-nucleotidase [Jeotgalibacillus soli]KIL42645.1 5'-nucleotidase [Jeotgalibacillus soli]
MKEKIYLYHTNDLHSHFENWPRIRDFIGQRKKYHQLENENVFLFDIGDHVDRSHSLTEGSKGKENIRLLNEVGYDAVTIGNNEGITFSHNQLQHLYDEAEFPVVVANLFTEKGVRPEWAKPYTILTTSKGTKLGIVGVTAEYGPFYERLKWRVTSAKDELKAQVRVLKEKVDIVIFLSHLGIREDEWVAEECPDIDIIMGGHTHHVLEDGKFHNKTLLAAAGKYGMYVGQVEIEFDHSIKRVTARSAKLVETALLPASLQEEEELCEWERQGKELLSTAITTLEKPLEHNPLSTSPLSQLLCSALKEWCKADCAFLTGGLLLDALPEGPVTEYDLHRILPHPINPCLVELSGAELKEVLRQSKNAEWPTMEVKGLGFRGTILGAFIYDGIELVADTNQFLVNHEPIINDQLYRVATVDMFTFGYFFPELQRAKKHYFMPEFLRDLLKQRIK